MTQKEIPFLENIIGHKCTTERTFFIPSCEVDTEVFKKMEELSRGQFPYEHTSEGDIVIFGNSPDSNQVKGFGASYRLAYAELNDVDMKVLPLTREEASNRASKLGVSILFD